MNAYELSKIILSPVISEKATHVSDKNNQIVFRVLKGANKYQIKAAVESLLNVKVDSVQVLNRKGKTTRGGKGCRRDVRRAYVCLEPGQQVAFSGVA